MRADVTRFSDPVMPPDGYEWVDCGNGRSVYRKIPTLNESKSELPSPYAHTDTLDNALYSGADGKQYTSKSALRASYKASNNPTGADFIEVGNEKITSKKSATVSEKGIEESLTKAFDRIS